MTESPIKPPIWFWVLAIIAVLWNLYGMWDWFNSITLNEKYLAAFPGWLEFIQGMPIWAKAGWSVAIVGSVLASLCLLLRKAWAIPLYILAFIGMVISFGYQLTSPTRPAEPSSMPYFAIGIGIFALFLIWFARKAKNKGWLT